MGVKGFWTDPRIHNDVSLDNDWTRDPFRSVRSITAPLLFCTLYCWSGDWILLIDRAVVTQKAFVSVIISTYYSLEVLCQGGLHHHCRTPYFLRWKARVWLMPLFSPPRLWHLNRGERDNESQGCPFSHSLEGKILDFNLALHLTAEYCRWKQNCFPC